MHNLKLRLCWETVHWPMSLYCSLMPSLNTACYNFFKRILHVPAMRHCYFTQSVERKKERERENGQNVALLTYQGRSILAFLLALQHKTKVLRQSSQCRSVCSCIAEPPNNPLAAGSQDKGQAHPRDTSHMRPSCKFAACHRKPSLHWASLPRNGSWHCLQECICWQRCWQHR